MSDDDIRKGAAYLARTQRLDHIVALDDFDVEMAAMLREYLNVPGMGQTTARGLPRQAGDAHPRARRGHPGARVRARAPSRDDCRVDRAATRRPGC